MDGRSWAARLVERARGAAGGRGKTDLEIAAEPGISNQMAARWRKGFPAGGLEARKREAPRTGTKRSIFRGARGGTDHA